MRNVFGWSMVLSGCLVGIALSQNAAQPDRERTQPRPGGAAAQPQRGERPGQPGGADRGAAASSDQQIAACIYIACHNHIQIAEFAQSKLTNPQAKQFAEKMVSDHSPGCEKMRELAGNLVSMRDHGEGGRELPGRATTPSDTPARPGARTEDRPGATPARPGAKADEGGGGGQDKDAADQREERQERREGRREAVRDAANKGVEVEVQPGGRPGVAVRAGAGGELNWINIHQEIADKCLSTLKKELGELQGANFDEGYMAHEVMVHLETIDKLTVLKNHASPTLRGDIDKSIQMAQGHLREAKQIKSQLKEAPDEPRLSRQPGKTTTPPATTPRTTPKNKDE